MATRLKISGLTRPGDVELAIEMGAWALGFAVAGEAQRPGARTAAETASEASHLNVGEVVELVGVGRARDAGVLTVVCVPGADPFETVRIAAAAGATAVEIGAQTDAVAVRAAMRAGGLAAAALIAARDAPGADEADYVVFPRRRADAPAVTDAGWDPVTRPAFKRVIVAGDIHPRDVGEIVRGVHPFAVDLGHSVQARPGLLDAARLRSLVAALAAADAGEP